MPFDLLLGRAAENAAVREMKWLCFIDGTVACVNGVMSIERGRRAMSAGVGKPTRSANIGDALNICTGHYEFRVGFQRQDGDATIFYSGSSSTVIRVDGRF